ncbi:hypothetical protein ACWGF3_08555 [Streptomyces xanthophaeus]
MESEVADGVDVGAVARAGADLEVEMRAADLAAHLATRHNRDHTQARAEYELHLMAARRPALRPAAIDGMLLDALLNDAPINPHTLRAVMDQTLQIPTKP